jgi:hypothetical protein
MKRGNQLLQELLPSIGDSKLLRRAFEKPNVLPKFILCFPSFLQMGQKDKNSTLMNNDCGVRCKLVCA